MYQFHDIGSGSGGGAAVLRFDRGFLRAPAPPRIPLLRAPLHHPVRHVAKGFSERLAELDLVADLATNIGSLEWCRGFALCAALCYSAYSFAPGLEPVVGAAPRPMADAQWEQARALSIAPLAYGADTGRRMAATDAVETLTDTPDRPSIDRLAALNPGDGLARALRRAGVGEDDAAAAAQLIGGAIAVDDIAPGTPANLTLGRRAGRAASRSLDLLAFRARFDLKLEVRRAGGRLVLNQIAIPVDNTPLRIQGRVGDSLYRAARAAGASPAAVASFIRAVATQMDIGRIGASDRFDMIIAQRRAATGETEVGQLLYAGLDSPSGPRLQLMQWEQDGKSQWFEATGVGKSTGTFERPVPGAVTSGFGSRMHPILGYTRMHKGIDFHAAYGSPIVAASDGRIVRAGWAGGYGRQVMIDHASGFQTSYSHMSRIVAEPGQFVHQGQVIGYVGTTGLSTGPHLHYELHRNGLAINPAAVRYTSQARLSGPALASFRSRLRSLLSVHAGGAFVSQTARADASRKPNRA